MRTGAFSTTEIGRNVPASARPRLRRLALADFADFFGARGGGGRGIAALLGRDTVPVDSTRAVESFVVPIHSRVKGAWGRRLGGHGRLIIEKKPGVGHSDACCARALRSNGVAPPIDCQINCKRTRTGA